MLPFLAPTLCVPGHFCSDMADWDGDPSTKAPPLLHANLVHLKKVAAVESIECSAVDLFDLTRDRAKNYQMKQND